MPGMAIVRVIPGLHVRVGEGEREGLLLQLHVGEGEEGQGPLRLEGDVAL